MKIKTGGDILCVWKTDKQCHLLDLQKSTRQYYFMLFYFIEEKYSDT